MTRTVTPAFSRFTRSVVRVLSTSSYMVMLMELVALLTKL